MKRNKTHEISASGGAFARKVLTVLTGATLFSLADLVAQTTPGPQPTICTRACWSARSPNCNPGTISSLSRAIIHHTAGSEFNTTGLTDSKARTRAIQNLDMDVNGWCDYSYHFAVDKFGNIFEGRLGSISGLPKAYHDTCNTAFGFVLYGYFHAPNNNTPTSIMLSHLYDVIAWRMPSGWSPYGSGNYCGGTVGTLDGHRKVPTASTACPGDRIYPNLITDNRSGGPMRTAVAARRSGATVHDRHIVGDWDGNGTFTPGVVRKADGNLFWYLRNSNSAGDADITFAYGLDTDLPVPGDWDGNGTFTPGIRRGNTWYLRNSNSSGDNDIAAFSFGLSTDFATVGDWDGNGTTTIGVLRENGGNWEWSLRNSNSAGTSSYVFNYGVRDTDSPVTGDWDNNGTWTPGIYRSNSWYLRNSNSSGSHDITPFAFGQTTDDPIVGDWDGNGTFTIGVVRGDVWYLRNSNSAGAHSYTFGYGQ